MRTRAKKKYVASDRARRENVPRHILFYFPGVFFIYREARCGSSQKRPYIFVH